MKRKFFKISACALALSLVFSACAPGAGGRDGVAPAAPSGDVDRPVITITSIFFSAEVPDHPYLHSSLLDITGYEIDVNWIPSTAFDDVFNTMLAADSLSMINTVPSVRTRPFINAISDGLIVTLDDYVGLPQFRYFHYMNEARWNNVRVYQGRISGIPRGRAGVRQGIVYRQDWAEEMGIYDQPTTTAQVEEMIRNFAARPETSFGIVGGAGTWYPEGVHYLAVYYGAPFGWGFDSNNNFTHMWLTDEFTLALERWAQWFDEGLLNRNFVEINSEDARRFLNTEEAGLIFVFTDDIANRWDDLFIHNPDARLWYAMQLNGRTFSTPGFAGVLAVGRNAVGDSDGLMHALTFLDALGSPEWQTICLVGLEDWTYIIEDGFATQTAEQSALHQSHSGQWAQINWGQFIIMPHISTRTIPALEAMNAERLLYLDTAIMNLATPFISETEIMVGATDLDPIRFDAINRYIMGAITREELYLARERWLAAGGQAVLEEIYEQYRASR